MVVTEPVLVAAIGAAAVVAAAIVGLFSAWLARVNSRLRRLEHRDKLSWLYIRSLIDHAYRYAPGVPLPEPPEGWLEDE